MEVLTKVIPPQHRGFKRRLSVVQFAMALIVAPCAVFAQRPAISIPVGAGSEIERYLRILQLVGKLPPGQWTVRPFGPSELSSMKLPANHPWARQFKDSSI